MDDFERKIGNVSHRSWDTILAGWLRHITVMDMDHPFPEYDSEDLPDFTELADRLIDKTAPRAGIREELDGLRWQVFGESLFFVYKAIHVLGASERHVSEGYVTWALAEAYESALFSAKSIMRLLGVTTIEYRAKNKTIIADIWPTPTVLTSKERKAGLQPPDVTLFLDSGAHRFGHEHVWSLFQRILRVAQVSTWPEEVVGTLWKELKPNEFGTQRNRIHYSAHKWIYDDLFNPQVDPTFAIGDRTVLLPNFFLFPKDIRSDFSVVLGYTLLKLALILFSSLAEETNIFGAQNKRMLELLTSEMHPLYPHSRVSRY